MRSDVLPGARSPDSLYQTKTTRRLSELQGKDPVILIPSRDVLPEGAPKGPSAVPGGFNNGPKFFC